MDATNARPIRPPIDRLRGALGSLGVVVLAASAMIVGPRASLAGEEALAGDDVEVAETAERAGPIRRAGGLLVVGGRALQLFTGGPGGASAYAQAINEYERELRGEVRVISMIAPTAQTFYLPPARVPRPEPPYIQATYGMMAPGVTTVDLVAALTAHRDEYIFFRTDHHWTGLGAYYAYEALCAAAGLKAVPLASMRTRTKPGFRGSLARMTRDADVELIDDEVEYWLPPTAVKVVRYDRDMVETPIKGPLIRERGGGYGVFLGGDYPLIVATTEAGTGRSALLIKNSLGNPLAVYLASHYDTLVIVDYRYFRGSVLDLVRDHGIDDLIILNGTITTNARYHSARVGWVIDGGARSRARRARERAGLPAASESSESPESSPESSE